MRFALALMSILATASASAQDSSTPTLLVVNKAEDTLAFVDLTTRQVLGKVTVGHIPHEVAASDDGKTAFVSNYGTEEAPSHSISVIDVAARKETRRVELSPLLRPHGLAFAEDKVYFTAEANKVIGRYDPASDRVDWIQGTGQDRTHMVSLSPDAKTIVTANILSDTISIWEQSSPLNGAWKQHVVPTGAGPEGFDLSPDGKEIWATNSRDGSVAIIDRETRSVTKRLDAGTKRSNRLKFTPDGKTVLVSDMGSGQLVVIDAASHAVARRLPLGRVVEGILITPDGATAFVALTDDNAIAVIDLQTFEIKGRIEPGLGPDGMAWINGR